MVRVASLSMSLPFPPLEDSGDPGIWTSLAPVPSNAPPEEGCCPCPGLFPLAMAKYVSTPF